MRNEHRQPCTADVENNAEIGTSGIKVELFFPEQWVAAQQALARNPCRMERLVGKHVAEVTPDGSSLGIGHFLQPDDIGTARVQQRNQTGWLRQPVADIVGHRDQH